MKLFWGRLLALLLIMSATKMNAQFTFTTNNGTITITGYSGLDGSVTIPDSTNGLPVTSIGVQSFENSTNLTNVIIPDSVTDIGPGAFGFCSALMNATIGKGVTNLEDFAFYQCISLTGLYFQGDAPSAGMNVFDGDYYATVFFLPSTTGWDSSFAGLSTFSSSFITNNGTITITGYSGFGGDVTIPGMINGLPVTSLGAESFFNRSNLTSVTIPDSVTNIGDDVFAKCSNLNGVIFLGDPPGIGLDVFGYDSNTTVFYWQGTTGWEGTFAGRPTYELYPFTYATNGGTITISGYNSFGGPVTVPSTINGLPVTSIGSHAFEYSYNMTSITIPDSVTNIGDWAFVDCTALKSVTLPNSVTQLGSLAFQGCSGLTNLTLPDSITNIPDEMVAYCTNLTTFTFPKTVTSIGDYAFEHTGLNRLTIPKTVINIGSDVFYACSNLSGVYFQGNAPNVVGSLVYFGETSPTIYYLPGTTGWTPAFGGLPTLLWNPHVQTSDTNFGLSKSGFGFNIVGTPNISLVVEANTDLKGSVWIPLEQCILKGGAFYFSDPQWTNRPVCFYRFRSP
jgi:hypothetical protein